MEIVSFIVAWMAGYFVCILGVISPLIVIRTALPLTKHLKQRGLINSAGANKQSAFTICLWLAIDAVIAVLLIMLAPKIVLIGFVIGCGVCFLFGIGQTGPTNTDNIKDYVKSYHRYLYEATLYEALEEIGDYPLIRRMKL